MQKVPLDPMCFWAARNRRATPATALSSRLFVFDDTGDNVSVHRFGTIKQKLSSNRINLLSQSEPESLRAHLTQLIPDIYCFALN
jgi:hypothetical protein